MALITHLSTFPHRACAFNFRALSQKATYKWPAMPAKHNILNGDKLTKAILSDLAKQNISNLQ